FFCAPGVPIDTDSFPTRRSSDLWSDRTGWDCERQNAATACFTVKISDNPIPVRAGKLDCFSALIYGADTSLNGQLVKRRVPGGSSHFTAVNLPWFFHIDQYQIRLIPFSYLSCIHTEYFCRVG